MTQSLTIFGRLFVVKSKQNMAASPELKKLTSQLKGSPTIQDQDVLIL